jgi:hypothetical protein
MIESALLVPVPEAEPVVGDLRTRYDSTAALGLPCHITVIYPFLHPSLLTRSVLIELTSIFAGVAPFRFSLGAIARFPDVVYLVPDPAGPFSRFVAAVATRWPEAPPYAGKYDAVIPHLTVAHTSDATAIEKIRKTIEPALPLACTADQVWLLTIRRDRWSVEQRFAFGGSPNA